MMGKKKVVKKTKEVSVAIAVSSSATTERLQAPRKRGRPRKVVLDKDVDKQDTKQHHRAQEFQEFEGITTDSKKAKISAQEEEEEEKGDKEKRLEDIKEMVGSSSNSRKGGEEKKGSPQKQQRKSRATKKGKPRKSS